MTQRRIKLLQYYHNVNSHQNHANFVYVRAALILPVQYTQAFVFYIQRRFPNDHQLK